MNLSIKELNDLYYCVGMMRLSDKVKMISDDEVNRLSDKIWNEIIRVNNKEEVDDEYIENIV